jgi:hypothetical protein
MENKVKVYGKAKGWTALGIIDAYLKIYPVATLEDLNKAFPREKFASTKSTDKILVDLNELENDVKANGTNREKADVAQWRKIHWYLTLEDGTEVIFYKIMWGESNFPAIVEHAKGLGIEVASFEKTKGGTERGSYELEYLAGFTFQVDGRMTVNTLQQEFKDAFNACLRVYEPSGKKANPKAHLAGLRIDGDATQVGSFEATNEMKVMDFEYKMKSIFGINVQVARSDDSKLSNDSSMLKDAGNN